MFTTKQGFRVLVLASIVLGLLAGAIDLLVPSLVPPELREAFNQLEASREYNFIVEGSLVIALLLAALVSTIGLLLFWKPARLIYIASFLASYVYIGVFGPQLSSGPSVAIELLSEFIAGIVAVLMYTKPISTHFEK